MSFIELNKLKQTQNGIPSFLLANDNWIKTYYEYKSTMNHSLDSTDIEPAGNTQSSDRKNYKEECYYTAYDDFTCTFGIGVSGVDNPIYGDLGNKAWKEIKTGVYLRKSIKVMERAEYNTFIKDPKEFLYSTCLKRLYANTLDHEILNENYIKFYRLIVDENAIFESLSQSRRTFFNLITISSPLDFLADFLRGTKELLMDIHSVPELVDHACHVITDLVLHQVEYYRKHFNMKHLVLPLHLPGLLSRRDFEKFYYPAYNTLVHELISKGYKILILFEGNVDRFIDIISKLDSDQVIAHFESTNIEKYMDYFQGKRTFLSGFYPSYILKYGNHEECIEAATKLRRKVEGNDRYIFSTNRVLFTGEDVKYDNLLMVYNYFSH